MQSTCVFWFVWGLCQMGFETVRHSGSLGHPKPTSCYAIMLPGRKSGFRAGFRPDSNRESLKIGPPAGRRPAGGPILTASRLESGRNPARKPDFRRGSIIVQPVAILAQASVAFLARGFGTVGHLRPPPRSQPHGLRPQLLCGGVVWARRRCWV